MSIPAFPEARGWGATALNASRGLPVRVLKVTNTNSSGAGSLREALETVSPDFFDIIIFRVGGRIEPDRPARRHRSRRPCPLEPQVSLPRSRRHAATSLYYRQFRVKRLAVASGRELRRDAQPPERPSMRRVIT
jgi:hypothetical protein